MGDSTALGAVRSAVAALNEGDVDGNLRYFAPSCPRWVPGFAQRLTLADIAGNFRLLYAAFENLHLDEDLLFGDERFARARWRLRGRHVSEYLGHAPKGRSINVDTCEIYEAADDLVVTSWAYGDLGQLFRQIAAGEGEAP